MSKSRKEVEVTFIDKAKQWLADAYNSVKVFFGGHAGAITLISGLIAVGAHYAAHLFMLGGILGFILNSIVAASMIVFVVTIALYIANIDFNLLTEFFADNKDKELEPVK